MLRINGLQSRGSAARMLVLAAVICAVIATSVNAQPPSTTLAPIIYRLSPTAQFQRGCFPPCMCPIMFLGQLRGTMILTPMPNSSTPALFDYRVDDVNWLANTGNIEWRLSGSGILHRVGAPSIGAQRLELDLKIGSDPVQHFDSGWVTPSAVFPNLNLTVSINGGVCFDTVLSVIASPVPANQLKPYRVLAGSTYQTGCWPPCTCPLLAPRPVTGGFTLVPIPSPTITPTAPIEYAVVNVTFNVLSLATTPSNPAALQYRGYGFYRRNLPSPTSTTSNHQRLFLELRRQVSVTPSRFEHFDSGVVPIPVPFPTIDVLISKNGMVCQDTVFDLRTAPPSIATP